ncbi:TolC family protein [Cognatishimia sp. MH4019]|uniref:TolC family protein n=1 Tax=Cognatishimia sp. MH4019 TaxID=2854030 RepID=UPI001CD4F4FB|nr:TolC family protein [Cognatishimia sp. MH4019]
MVLALSVAGCLGETGLTEAGETVSRMAAKPIAAVKNLTAPDDAAMGAEEAQSETILTLQARRSILPAGSSYARISDAVLAANSRAAEAELRSARLRARAASKNWLPSIGPSISLTSLGDVVTQLLLEQVLFDHGRKKAEREFAAHDVEVAAADLSIDTNTRVFSALSLYLDAQTARAREQVMVRRQSQLRRFEDIVRQRVDGGVSDLSDLRVMQQKLAELDAEIKNERERQVTALAELNAMSARDIQGVDGVTSLAVPRGERALSVVRAQAEADREVAQAKIDRAGILPGLTARGTVDESGTSGELTAGGDGLLNIGMGANLKALEAKREAAQREVSQAEEDANRQLRRFEAQLASLERQQADAAALTAPARANFQLFQEQFQAGQRTIMDVVNTYEAMMRLEQDQASLPYDIARVKLEIARDRGVLADGGDV